MSLILRLDSEQPTVGAPHRHAQMLTRACLNNALRVWGHLAVEQTAAPAPPQARLQPSAAHVSCCAAPPACSCTAPGTCVSSSVAAGKEQLVRASHTEPRLPTELTCAVHGADRSGCSALCMVSAGHMEDGIRLLGWVMPHGLAHAPLLEPLNKSAHQRFTCTRLCFGHHHACMNSICLR